MRVNKPRRMKWVGRVARVGEKVNSYSVSCLYFKERNRVKSIGVNRKRIIKWVFDKYVGETWRGLFRLRVVASGGLL
jgi:hypothetical protein